MIKPTGSWKVEVWMWVVDVGQNSQIRARLSLSGSPDKSLGLPLPCTLYTSRNQQDRTEPQAQRFLRTVSGRVARRTRAGPRPIRAGGTHPTRSPSADGPQKTLRLRLCRTSARTAVPVSRHPLSVRESVGSGSPVWPRHDCLKHQQSGQAAGSAPARQGLHSRGAKVPAPRQGRTGHVLTKATGTLPRVERVVRLRRACHFGLCSSQASCERG